MRLFSLLSVSDDEAFGGGLDGECFMARFLQWQIQKIQKELEGAEKILAIEQHRFIPTATGILQLIKQYHSNFMSVRRI